MDEQKTLTLDFIKSLMEPAYTLIWTDYNDNLDNHCGLIQKCLDSKSREHLWEKADEWYSDADWEAVREIIAKLKEEMADLMGWSSRTPYAKRENGIVSIGADELAKMASILGFERNQLEIFFTTNVLDKERK